MSLFRSALSALAALVLSATIALGAPAPKKKVVPKPPPAPPPPQTLNLPGEINDEQIEVRLDQSAEELLKAGRTVGMGELLRQAQRRRCSVELPKLTLKKTSAAELAARSRAGVLVIGDLSKCRKCPRWHVGASSGFILTESGVAATCWHVVNVPESPTLIAMTGDGRVVPVKEVLAANPDTDVAILKLEGGGFTPLPLDSVPPVGVAVRVFSHPDDHFYTLTEGMVSRYVSIPAAENAPLVTMMAITADFGVGSSGAPVFNENGGVVGIVNNTQSLYYEPRKGRDLQMVFKHCLPSEYILKLIRPK
jgi:S1-C subfamily serine protease